MDEGDVQHIRIIVPHHPLYNQDLKVVRHQHGDYGHEIVIELPDGETQLIPARWTEVSPSLPHNTFQSLVLLDPDSLRSLRIMVTSLITTQQPEACDADDAHHSSVANIQSGNSSTDHSPVGRAGPPSTSSPSVAPARRSR